MRCFLSRLATADGRTPVLEPGGYLSGNPDWARGHTDGWVARYLRPTEPRRYAESIEINVLWDFVARSIGHGEVPGLVQHIFLRGTGVRSSEQKNGLGYI